MCTIAIVGGAAHDKNHNSFSARCGKKVAHYCCRLWHIPHGLDMPVARINFGEVQDPQEDLLDPQKETFELQIPNSLAETPFLT